MAVQRKRDAQPAAAADVNQRPLVLLVDDFADNREMYAQYFAWSGFRVAEASTGQEAIEAALKLAPQLIVMDLSLPGIDGWEATRRLKQDDRTRAIPVVALTGHTLERHSQGALEAGCDAFLTKPCEPARLVETVRSLIAPRHGSVPPPAKRSSDESP